MENGKANSGSNPKVRPRVVVVGSGFAGFTCARELQRRFGPEDAELALVSSSDYLLYSPILSICLPGALTTGGGSVSQSPAKGGAMS